MKSGGQDSKVYKRSDVTRERMRAAALLRWSKPKFHKKASAAIRAGHNTEEAKEIHRAASLLWWKKRRSENTKDHRLFAE